MFGNKCIVFCQILCFFPSVFCQNFEELKIKEEYDLYNYTRVHHNAGELDPCFLPADNDQGAFGNGVAKILEGYISMYKATQDKHYLYQFISQSLCMMQNRHDFASINNEPRWSERMYEDGYIVASFSKFVHFIKHLEPSLINTLIHPFPEIANNGFGQSFSTFGQYAEWLQDRCGETLWWYIDNGYWDDDIGMKKSVNDNFAAEINMQVGFARAFLYIGITSGEPLLLNKAYTMEELFTGNVSFSDRCEGYQYDNPVFIVNSDNAYWWYHNGWSIPLRDCGVVFNLFPYFYSEPNFEGYSKYYEDISHGTIVTWMIYDYYHHLPNTSLDLSDMIRFRNTFTKNIYDGNGGFYNSVNGTDYLLPNDPCGVDIPCSHSYYSSDNYRNPLNYINYHTFDPVNSSATSPGVYDIIMEYYENNVAMKSVHPYSAQDNKGHAEVVHAQWQRECPDLSIYKRNLVYDQDLFAKGLLTIEPTSGSVNNYSQSFALPYINTPSFTIQSGVTSELTGGKGVTLKPGFSAKQGATVTIKPDDRYCDQSVGGGKSLSYSQDKNLQTIHSDLTESITNARVFPNPFNTSFTLECTEKFIGGSYQVYDLLGSLVTSGSITDHITVINDFEGSAKGLYSVVLQKGEMLEVQKVVKE